jgi:hypothetical protein
MTCREDIDFLPRVNYRREARVSQHRLGKSLTIEVRRKSSVQLPKANRERWMRRISGIDNDLQGGHR